VSSLSLSLSYHIFPSISLLSLIDRQAALLPYYLAAALLMMLGQQTHSLIKTMSYWLAPYSYVSKNPSNLQLARPLSGRLYDSPQKPTLLAVGTGCQPGAWGSVPTANTASLKANKRSEI